MLLKNSWTGSQNSLRNNVQTQGDLPEIRWTASASAPGSQQRWRQKLNR
ncbi:unnamed protein product [Nyctereutes procyonoides]|uniref:(raccoon dog) hypothetical protein n=1 Tax=Nyctereutes procyonoides TaxID=34880 RepID=A0A811Z4M3_NYCPR|nr:unnamed protein product [Nyctereutes procyonoides]